MANSIITRRVLINAVLIGVCFGIKGLIAEEKSMMIVLINALNSTSKPVCHLAATKLLTLTSNESNYDLHLRSANLTNDDVKRISAAIQAVHEEGGPTLQSFSMSYNFALGDEGLFDLLKALPFTVTEVGLVKCGLSNKSADALIAWAAKAPKLHWLCIEHNAFSGDIKEKFIMFGKERSGLLVVV